jgi:hypothetical protein
MGLDMYLTAERYMWDFGDNNDKEIAAAIGKLFPEIGDKRVKQVEVEIAYWRKANAIHDWLVQNVQDGVDECQKSYVTHENLRNLLNICKSVLANPDQAGTLLPTRSGFFFGGTEYDEWYFDGIKHTVEVLEDIVPRIETDFKMWTFYYQSSW